MAQKILIIDDEVMIRESLAGILSDEGFESVLVEDGEAGLAVLKNESIDLVLLDIWMPGMDGMEVLPKIKEQFADLPVIMISGHGNIETAVQATKMGAFDFIEKPPSYDKIILSITNALKLSSLARENEILKAGGNAFKELTGVSAAMGAPASATDEGGTFRGMGVDSGRTWHRQGTGGPDHPSLFRHGPQTHG